MASPSTLMVVRAMSMMRSNAGDESDGFQRDAHLREDHRDHDEGRAGHAHGADGGEDGEQDDGELPIERHGDAVDLGGEDGGDAHVNGRAVHVDGVAERDGEGRHGPGRAELLGR